MCSITQTDATSHNRAVILAMIVTLNPNNQTQTDLHGIVYAPYVLYAYVLNYAVRVEQFLSYLMGVQIKNFYFVIWSLEEADKDWMIWLVGGWVSVSSDTGSPR